jgi:hypothetical protein
MINPKRKTSAYALNEVTVIIIKKTDKDREHYHESFMADLNTQHTFEYEGVTYNMPVGNTTHYNPSFWNFPAKWALFFEQHKTWARFFDWFQLRKKVVYEVGFIYEQGKADPLNPKRPTIDFALECWNIKHNTVIESRLKNVGVKLNRTQPSNMKWWAIVAVVIIVAVVAVIALQMFVGKTPDASTVTLTPTPYPTPIILR